MVLSERHVLDRGGSWFTVPRSRAAEAIVKACLDLLSWMHPLSQRKIGNAGHLRLLAI